MVLPLRSRSCWPRDWEWHFDHLFLCHSMQPPSELCRLCTMLAVFASGKVFYASASRCAWSRLRCACQQHDTVGSLCVCVFDVWTWDIGRCDLSKADTMWCPPSYVFWLKPLYLAIVFSAPQAPIVLRINNFANKGPTAFYLGPFHSLKSAVTRLRRTCRCEKFQVEPTKDMQHMFALGTIW